MMRIAVAIGLCVSLSAVLAEEGKQNRGENGLSYPLADMRMRPESQGLQSYVGMLFGDELRTGQTGAKPHQGWDLFAPEGTPVYAIADGRVLHVQENHPDYGIQLIVSFSLEGVERYAQFAHLSSVDVAKGAEVRRGQRIAKSGVSGNGDTKYPHLHFEVRTISDLKAGSGLASRLDPAGIFPAMYKVYEDYAKRRTGTID